MFQNYVLYGHTKKRKQGRLLLPLGWATVLKRSILALVALSISADPILSLDFKSLEPSMLPVVNY
jgi:hypothetical protein